ncbi:MAG TPA: CYTH domain-containing protein [Bacteroidales bacterium]|nr:CYTH domain-containing protein [Bacteroidales bacterium]HSA43671.1 CYTH domain-containing protein [Bacteroidales bacterium]
MPLEIERKFLTTSDAYRVMAKARHIIQGYLIIGETATVRLRISDDTAWITVKGKQSGISRAEFEYPIPVADAETMLKLSPYAIIEKYRYRIPFGGFVWEVDEFLGMNHGLVIAEIELPEEAAFFEKPDWIGEEVSQDHRYQNSNLAMHPYRLWGGTGV